MATVKTITAKASMTPKYIAGGCDRASKIPKLQRPLDVGVRLGGAARPTTGQMYPRGQ